MANCWPAMAMAPVRDAPVFAPMLNATVPLPVPLGPPLIAIQGALGTAVQAHPALAVTAIGVPVPPTVLND